MRVIPTQASASWRRFSLLFVAGALLSPVPQIFAETPALPTQGAAFSGQAEAMSCTTGAGLPNNTLTGVVQDGTGAAIAHAQLVLSCGSFRATATSSEKGVYSFSAPAGPYHLEVKAKGFGTLEEDVTLLNQSSGTELNPVLHVGRVTNHVTVRAGNLYTTEVSSAGTKMEIPLNQVPQVISVVNRELMNSQGVVKLDDALRNVAGVMPGGYYSGWDYYRIRGFDSSFNTYIDGLRGGNGMMEETWGLQSIDVIQGPSSTLYGAAPVGGIVNLVTRKPIPQNFTHAQVVGGSYGFLDEAVDAGRVLNPSHTLYARFDGIYHMERSYVDYVYRHRYYLAPSLTWKPSDATSLTVMGHFQRDNGRAAMPLPAVGTVLPNPNGKIPIHTYIGELGSNANKLAQTNRQFAYQFSQRLNQHFTLRQNARFDWYNQHWNRLYYPLSLDANDRTLNRYPLSWEGPWQDQAVDTSLEGKGRVLGLENHALLGVDFFRNINWSKGWYGASQPLDLYDPNYGVNNTNETLVLYTQSKTHAQDTGVYLEDHILLPHRVTVTAGGRLDLAKNETKGSPNANANGYSPRAGLTWQVVKPVTLYADFGKSFSTQSGQVYDGTLSGHSIAPERGQQWEGGVKSQFLNNRLNLDMALFQLNLGNVATTDPNHPNFSIVTGEQRSRGVELQATANLLPGWNLTSAYSYVNAIVTKDNTIPVGTPTLNAPKNIFNVWSTYELQHGLLRGLEFGVGGNRYSKQSGDTNNTFQLPAYGLLRASASYRWGHAKWQVNAYNLADTRYYTGSYNALYVHAGDPRSVRGTMSWEF